MGEGGGVMTDRATIKWLHRNGWVRAKWLFDKDDSYLIPPGSLVLHTKALFGVSSSKMAFELEMPEATLQAAIIVVRCIRQIYATQNRWRWVYPLDDGRPFRLFVSDNRIWVKEPKA